MGLRPIHIAGFAQLPHVAQDNGLDEAEMVRIVTAAALEQAGMGRSDVGFTCSGSSDYAQGKPFSFTMALDGVGPTPPIIESHVESDGAWAMYEAWVRLQHGDVDTALVYCYGQSTLGDFDKVLGMQMDPYTEAPLGARPEVFAALQARILIEGGRFSERDFAQVVAQSRTAARDNPNVPDQPTADVDSLLALPFSSSPLRAHDGPFRTDGAAALVLRVGGGGPRIAGLDHRIESMSLGVRDLAVARSAEVAAEAVGGCGDVDAAELHAPYSPQQLMLAAALGLPDGIPVNPSGGSLVAETPMVSGLVRIGEAAALVRAGARKVVATATAGPCLQQNLICVLEAS
jgi:acetyl-CoA acetyltransferase